MDKSALLDLIRQEINEMGFDFLSENGEIILEGGKLCEFDYKIQIEDRKFFVEVQEIDNTQYLFTSLLWRLSTQMRASSRSKSLRECDPLAVFVLNHDLKDTPEGFSIRREAKKLGKWFKNYADKQFEWMFLYKTNNKPMRIFSSIPYSLITHREDSKYIDLDALELEISDKESESKRNKDDLSWPDSYLWLTKYCIYNQLDDFEWWDYPQKRVRNPNQLSKTEHGNVSTRTAYRFAEQLQNRGFLEADRQADFEINHIPSLLKKYRDLNPDLAENIDIEPLPLDSLEEAHSGVITYKRKDCTDSAFEFVKKELRNGPDWLKENTVISGIEAFKYFGSFQQEYSVLLPRIDDKNKFIQKDMDKNLDYFERTTTYEADLITYPSKAKRSIFRGRIELKGTNGIYIADPLQIYVDSLLLDEFDRDALWKKIERILGM